MAEIQSGKVALLWGVPSIGIKVNGGSAIQFTNASGAAFVVLSIDHERMSSQVVTPDATGEPANVTNYATGDKLTLTIKPAGNTRANAEVASEMFPRPGGYLQLINATSTVTYLDDTSPSSTLGGISAAATTPDGLFYRIDTASRSMEGQNSATWTLTVVRHDNWTNSAVGYGPLT